MKIFVTYRREDAASEAGRIATALRQKFGDESVFMDITSISPGTKWPERLCTEMQSADTVVVVIGPDWLRAASDEWSRRRIDDPNDWVRIEVSLALSEDKRVIPTLVRAAKLPPSDALPPDLHELPGRQIVEIRTDFWDHDIKLLLWQLEESSDFSSDRDQPVGRYWQPTSDDTNVGSITAVGSVGEPRESADVSLRFLINYYRSHIKQNDLNKEERRMLDLIMPVIDYLENQHVSSAQDSQSSYPRKPPTLSSPKEEKTNWWDKFLGLMGGAASTLFAVFAVAYLVAVPHLVFWFFWTETSVYLDYWLKFAFDFSLDSTIIERIKVFIVGGGGIIIAVVLPIVWLFVLVWALKNVARKIKQVSLLVRLSRQGGKLVALVIDEIESAFCKNKKYRNEVRNVGHDLERLVIFAAGSVAAELGISVAVAAIVFASVLWLVLRIGHRSACRFFALRHKSFLNVNV